jgi:hypothetical protein
MAQLIYRAIIITSICQRGADRLAHDSETRWNPSNIAVTELDDFLNGNIHWFFFAG